VASVLAVIADVMRSSGIDAARIAAIGITNQRETSLVWERHTSAPVHRALVWQDRRTAGVCEALKADGHEPRIRERTGLSSTPTSPPPRSPGSSTTSPARPPGPLPASWPRAPSTPTSCGA
jgi:glycerol kinase